MQTGGPGARTPIKVYFFNIDLMYILKARLWVLDKQLKERIDSKNLKGTFYVCPRSKEGLCQNKEEVGEGDFTVHGRNVCSFPQCGEPLVANRQSSLDSTVSNGAKKIIADL